MPFPVASSFIARAEELLGIELPRAYKERMQVRNGGEIEFGGEAWELYPILDDSDRRRLSRTCNDILYETKEARKWTRFPPEAVAIASDGTGNKLVFLPRVDSLAFGNEVYCWDHETGSLTKVADDF